MQRQEIIDAQEYTLVAIKRAEGIADLLRQASEVRDRIARNGRLQEVRVECDRLRKLAEFIIQLP